MTQCALFVQSPPHSYAELQMQLEAYTEDMATAPLIYTTEAKRNEEMDAMRKTSRNSCRRII